MSLRTAVDLVAQYQAEPWTAQVTAETGDVPDAGAYKYNSSSRKPPTSAKHRIGVVDGGKV